MCRPYLCLFIGHTRVLQESLLLRLDAVARLVAPLVRAIKVHLLLLLEYRNWLGGERGRRQLRGGQRTREKRNEIDLRRSCDD